jgi:rubredoxin
MSEALTVNPRKPSHLLSIPMSSWACKRCTFINPASRKPTCQICLASCSSPSSSPPSPSAPKWQCKACTFLNHFGLKEGKVREKKYRGLKYFWVIFFLFFPPIFVFIVSICSIFFVNDIGIFFFQISSSNCLLCF